LKEIFLFAQVFHLEFFRSLIIELSKKNKRGKMKKFFSLILVLSVALAIHCHKVHDEYEREGVVNEEKTKNQQKPNPKQPQQQQPQQPKEKQKQKSKGKLKYKPSSTNSSVNSTESTMDLNKEHVLEHLDGVINKTKEQMTEEEQNFYFFKLHDYDNNNVLDGIELVTAVYHRFDDTG
jgi:hypothetical protein